MASEPAYAKLRDAIVNGQLQPNERLVEADLSRSYGYARAAIRTALVLLEQEGLVAREPNRGARVRLISADEAIEITDAREALEGVAARYAAMRATDEDVADLHRIVAGMRELLDRGDLLGVSDEGDVLHRRMLQIASHETIARLIAMLKSQTVRFQYRTILVPGRPQEAFDEHAAIVEAIAARDPEGAERAMRAHIGRIRHTLVHHADGRGEVR
jgi:DNA-binding GntR family transcriptional regulator